MLVSKDKKIKKKDKKSAGKSSSTLKSLASNPMIADIVATALVATASALKDSKRARALASEAGDDLVKLSKSGVKSGEALWEMALQIGRRSLDELVAGNKTAKSAKPAKPSKPAKPAKPAKLRKAASKPASKKTSTSGRKR
jgi:hypothetical protein